MLTDDHERGFGRVDGTSAAECENRIGIHVHHKFHGFGNKLDRRIGFDIREHGDLFAGGHVRFHRIGRSGGHHKRVGKENRAVAGNGFENAQGVVSEDNIRF